MYLMEKNRLAGFCGLSILEITPLSRHLREKIESGQLDFKESYDLMVGLSELIAEKSSWLLPLSGLEREEAACLESGENAGEETYDGWFPDTEESQASKNPFMGKEELAFAQRILWEKLEYARKMFPRAFFQKPKGTFLVTETLSADMLSKAMFALSKDSHKEQRVLVIPRWNFVQRLKALWQDIRRISTKAMVMRFSWFLGKGKNECILNFLVFLELVKRGRLFAKQEEPSGEIFFSTKKEVLLAEDTEGKTVGD